MIRIFVRHKVDDYAVWRMGYDAFESARTKLSACGTVESRCGAVAVGLVCLLPPLSSGGARVTSP